MPKYIVSFLIAFLYDRRQFVRVGGAKSNILNCDIGCPQGCVLSPVLFSIYTDFIRSNHSDFKIFRNAADMALVRLLNYKTDHSFYYDAIEHYIEQCRDVNLLINAKKTQEMVLSFSSPFYVFLKFKDFKPTSCQKQYFIQTHCSYFVL